MVSQIRSFVAPFVELDRYAASRPDRRYCIASLYLDSDDFKLYRTTVEGLKSRFKLRIRAYSDSSEDPVYFEVKRRDNQVVRKRRAPVDRRTAMDYLLGSPTPALSNGALGSSDFDEFLDLGRQTDARPALRVRYLREAYESTGLDPVRVTFDTELMYSVVDAPYLGIGAGSWRETPVDGLIVELKFTDLRPSWVDDLIRIFELDKQSVAKYVLSLGHALETGWLRTEARLASLRPGRTDRRREAGLG